MNANVRRQEIKLVPADTYFEMQTDVEESATSLASAAVTFVLLCERMLVITHRTEVEGHGRQSAGEHGDN